YSKNIVQLLVKEAFVMSKRQGIKRHEALQPLSRHHMIGLHVGLKLSRAETEKSKISIEQIIEDTREFWFLVGQDHFREEEEILLLAYAAYANMNQTEIIEMLLEHIKISSEIDRLLNEELNNEEIREFGSFLHDHIRKEERILFPMIEAALPEVKLQKLALLLYD